MLRQSLGNRRFGKIPPSSVLFLGMMLYGMDSIFDQPGSPPVPPAHLQPTHLEGRVRNKGGLDAVQALFINS